MNHHVLWTGNIDYLNRCVPEKSATFEHCQAPKSIRFSRAKPCDHFHGIEHENPAFWCDSELLQASGRREMAQTLSRPPSPSIDLSRPRFKSDENRIACWILGILTHIFGKSVSRRFSWCNSQLLTPSGLSRLSWGLQPSF